MKQYQCLSTVKLILNINSENCRSINKKRKSIEDFLDARFIDIGVFSELNTKNPPKIKGFHQFNKISKLKFHGVCIYVKNHLKGSVLCEDSELEIVHLISK